MATRGVFGFKIKGEEKLIYNSHDSYLDGLGEDMAKFSHRVDLRHMKPMARNLKECEQNPAIDQMEPSQIMWSIFQGDVTEIPNAKDFLQNGLFCEYGYILDLDRKMFQVYISGEMVYEFPLKKIPSNWKEIVKQHC